MSRSFRLVRYELAGGLLENFFVSAVAAILAIRLYILLGADTPLTTKLVMQINAGSFVAHLHIAHMLWGGLLMLVALALALVYLSHWARVLASILGGIGFGIFIDEIGKFITLNNNYFFQPAIALIYITLVILFLVFQALRRPRHLSEQEALANVMEVVKQSVIRDISVQERAQALALLQRCSPQNPTAALARKVLTSPEYGAAAPPHFIDRGRTKLRAWFRRLAGTWWFPSALIIFLIFQSLASLYETALAVAWSQTLLMLLGIGGPLALLAYGACSRSSSRRVAQTVASGIMVITALAFAWSLLIFHGAAPETWRDWLMPALQVIEPGTGFRHRALNVFRLLLILSPLVSNILVASGMLFITYFRLTAYRLFHLAIMISIFFTQVAVFYEHQLLGVVGLLPNLLILATLRYLIRQEEREADARASQAIQVASQDGVRKSEQPERAPNRVIVESLAEQ